MMAPTKMLAYCTYSQNCLEDAGLFDPPPPLPNCICINDTSWDDFKPVDMQIFSRSASSQRHQLQPYTATLAFEPTISGAKRSPRMGIQDKVYVTASHCNLGALPAWHSLGKESRLTLNV